MANLETFPGFDGAPLALRRLGEGRPVVLLHGLFSSAEINWLKFGTAARLAEAGFCCLMPDLRAHGASAAPHDPAAYPADVLARDAEALVAHLGRDVFDLVGFSLGARTAARSVMVAVCMAMSCLSLMPLMFTHDLYVSLACLSAGFFFAEMTIGPMWAVPMDIAQDCSGTASGIMNTGSALAAIISPVVSGYVIDRTGNWELPFLGSILLMLLGVFLAFRMRPRERLSFATDGTI